MLRGRGKVPVKRKKCGRKTAMGCDYKKANILIVDDNEELCRLLAAVLLQDGYSRLEYALSCGEAERLLGQKTFHLMLLDVNFPGEDGFHFYERIRRDSDLPVIFLSARDQSEDRLRGLGLGADDYVTKPFLSKELTLRCGAVLKRTYRGEEPTGCFWVGKRIADLEAGVIWKTQEGQKAGEAIPLSNKEYQLLRLFLENRGRILTLDMLAESVWGSGYCSYENTLMVHIRRLREKLEEEPSRPKWLITVKGLGYRLNR